MMPISCVLLAHEGVFDCCCFEQLSGLAFDWLAPGNKEWRQGFTSFQDNTARFPKSKMIKNVPWPAGKKDSKGWPVQNPEGSLRVH